VCGFNDVVVVSGCGTAIVPVVEDVKVYFYLQYFFDVVVVVMVVVMIVIVIVIVVMVVVVVVVVYLSKLELQTSLLGGILGTCARLDLLEPSLLPRRPNTIVVCVVETSKVR
jgi:hypothetical protein